MITLVEQVEQKSWKVKLTPPGHPNNLVGGDWQADLYYDPPEKPLQWKDMCYGETRKEALERIKAKAKAYENPPDVEWVAI